MKNNQLKINIMKKKLIVLCLLVGFQINIYSQEYEKTKIIEIQAKIDKLEKSKSNYNGQQLQAINGQILALEQEKTNLINSIKEQKQSIEQQNNDFQNVQKNQLQQNQLQILKTQQENSRQSFYNEMNNSLNSLANSMQNVSMMQIYNNLKARQYTIDNFAKDNQQKLDKIISIYNSIPKENFNKTLNGTYKAYFISNKKFSYAPNYELSYVEDCYVKVENNTIVNIYMFGNKELENNLPSENKENSVLKNGIVKYIDIESLDTYNVVILEPYLKNTDTNLSLKENNVGYIVIWSSNKEDEGKIAYVQELQDNYTKLNREIIVKIQYAKNEKDIKSRTNISKTAFNLNYTLFFLGEVTNTPYGRIPLAIKIADVKENEKPLSSNEIRFVQVKKYRQ